MFHTSSIYMEELSIPGIVEKNRTRIGDIVQNYGKRLFGFIRGRVSSREEAEDILQEVWYQLSRIIDLESIEHLSGWLFQVARNRITDQYRRKQTESLDSQEEPVIIGDVDFREILLADPSTPETESLKDMFWEELFVALNELPENQKQVFILNEMENMTLREIADKTGENLKTIISRKGYAVKHLRNRLEDLYRDFINY
jgi:RNA polymerase sigma factor (sigma-70 family)